MLYNNNMIFRKKPKKLGLALGGGGAKGIAHIGAFRAFAEHDIHFDYVAGTSVGSIMGALYCAGVSWQKLAEVAHTIKQSDLIDNRILKVGNSSNNIAELIRSIIGDVSFDMLPTPLCAVAVDLITGNEVILDKGEVAIACSASSAVPAIFTSVAIDDMNLVDGGLVNNIPADVVRRMGADNVVSIDLSHDRGQGTKSHKMLDQLGAVWRIVMKSNASVGIMQSDILIQPELRTFSSMALDNVDKLIQEGYRSTLQLIPAIKALK